MKKTFSMLLALVLLLTLSITSALAASEGNLGDVGGARAAELEAQLRNGLPPQASGNTPTYYTPSQSMGQPSGSYPGSSGQGGTILNSNPNPGSGNSGSPVFVNNDMSSQIPYEGNGTGSSGGFPGTIGTPENNYSLPPNAYIPSGDYSSEVNPDDYSGEVNPGGSGGSSSGTQSLDWFSVGFDLINANKNITVYDINTGVTWSARYINGANHADVIPATEADYQKLKSNNITGSYVRRPVIVTIAGTPFAGSMYAVGHGSTNYCSYFKGVMCIHFTGSMTHGSKKVDSDHQKAIQSALGY